MMVALPYLFVLGLAAAGFWGIGEARDQLQMTLPDHAGALSIWASGVKVIIFLLAWRTECVLVESGLPYLIREVREVMNAFMGHER
jgi:hypothetical protein